MDFFDILLWDSAYGEGNNQGLDTTTLDWRMAFGLISSFFRFKGFGLDITCDWLIGRILFIYSQSTRKQHHPLTHQKRPRLSSYCTKQPTQKT